MNKNSLEKIVRKAVILSNADRPDVADLLEDTVLYTAWLVVRRLGQGSRDSPIMAKEVAEYVASETGYSIVPNTVTQIIGALKSGGVAIESRRGKRSGYWLIK